MSGGDAGQVPLVSLLHRCLVLTALGSWLFYASEWLFFVTKPSIFDALTVAETLSALGAAALPLCGLLAAAAVSLSALLSLTGPALALDLRVFALGLGPALVLTAAELLMLDNFTYTLLGFATHGTSGLARLAYAALLFGLLVYNLRLAASLLCAAGWRRAPGRIANATSALLVAVGLLWVAYGAAAAGNPQVELGRGLPEGERPNILIFSSDGISAPRTSAYGYARKTTPFLESLARESLLFRNHFTNSSKTTGSVGALLSAKHPTRTRLIFRPDVFQGIDVYQHLPGLLRQAGYTNGDFSIRHYADPYDLNMRDGFHWANGRDLESEALWLPRFYRRALPSATLFIEETWARVSGRVLHLLDVREMHNPYHMVTRPDRAQIAADADRVAELLAFIERTPEPWFAHIHLMGTHGGRFPEGEAHFALGQEQTEDWQDDFYDDAVLQSDRYLEQVVGFLRDREVLEKTLLIVNSDHGFRWGIVDPIPLVIRLPGAGRSGEILASSQRIDIAPSIVDAIGLPVPEWMDGRSLLVDDLPRARPIFIVDRVPAERISGWVQVVDMPPPFYTLGSVTAIYCNRAYRFDLIGKGPAFSWARIDEHVGPCRKDDFPEISDAHAAVVSLLEAGGYDVRAYRNRDLEQPESQ